MIGSPITSQSAVPLSLLPVAQVCAGNRRKEQNMVKKSKGFSWGPAATGCSYWTGVRMSTLLRLAGVHTPDQVPLCFRSQKA